MIDSHVIEDSELLRHIPAFRLPLLCAEEEAEYQLRTKFSASVPTLCQRQQDVLTLREQPTLVSEGIQLLEDCQQDEQLLRAFKPSTTSKAAEGQVFFSGEYTKPLNFVPYLVTILVFLKLYIFPILGLLTPILLFCMPYVILKTMFDQSMPWDMYVTMMKQMMFGLKPGEPFTLKQAGQAAWTIVSLGQGMIQPILTAYHTKTLDTTIVERGEALLRLHSVASHLVAQVNQLDIHQHTLLAIPDIPSEPRLAAAWMEAEPLGLKLLWKTLGRLSILFRLADDTAWHNVHWSRESTLKLHGCADLAIDPQRAVKSELLLEGHALLTGPNRGGKSSNLRAIVQQLLLGQTFGFTYHCEGSWMPFSTIYTRLKSRDHSGKESLFEMEVRHAASILHSITKSRKHALVLIDELFHSTNPPDAETSAIMFLEQLWEHSHVKSIISTHIFSLCEQLPSHVEALCCPAEETDAGIIYSYTLQPGICRVSSVQEVLVEHGLL